MLGNGTQANPYLISTPAELDAVRNNLTAYYELTNDIDMSSIPNFNPIGDTTSAKRFKGFFNGNGFKIKNLTINKSTICIGLFAFMDGGKVENLGIENANVIANSQNYVGILVGQSTPTTKIINCYTTGQVSGQYGVGGLIGYADGTIDNSYSHAKVTGAGRVGGLIGNGISNFTKINNCYSTGLVTVTPDPNLFNGGLIGSFDFTTNVTNSYYDINTSGQTISAGGQGKTTTELKQQSTYIGWDFTSIWGINGDYPYLQMFGQPTAPPKKETITVATYANPLHSTTNKNTKSIKHTESILSPILTLNNKEIKTKRYVDTYTLPIRSSVQKYNRTVRNSTQTVDSFISPIYSSHYRESKTIKELLSYMKPLQAHVDVLIPIENKVVNAYLSVIQNPSSVSEVANCSEVYKVLNPSEVEVIT